MLCKYCGYQIKQGIKICPNCGRSVSVDSEGMRHDEDTVFENEADYRKSKPKRQPQRDSEDVSYDQPHKMGSGIKAVIIIAVVVLAVAAGVLFALKGGYLKSFFGKAPETSEEAAPVILMTKPIESDTAEDNTGAQNSETNFSTGYYKITKSNGAAMYTSNRIYNENASHIVANGKYVEIKAFEYNDSYTLGFACENGEYYGWIRMSDAEYAPDYKPGSTTKPESTTAKTPENTTAKPAETTKAPETTTAKPSTGRYKVSDSVGDNLNVRKGPGTDYDVVDSLDIGTGVTVVEWNGSWAHISVNGNDAGYVYGAYLDKE